MHAPQWTLFFDFHTMPAVPDVGAGFDVERFTDHVKACGVDYMVFPAKCNLGMSYYNTRVGIRHPALQYDLLGRLAEACHRKSIALSAYINVGLSHEHALRHRDWAIVWPEGYTYRPDRLDHFFRYMCYNTPYADFILETVREVLTGYPVAGLFLDCWGVYPCVGGECVRAMKTLGLDWHDPQQVRAFAHRREMDMARRIAATARKLRPDALLFFNGLPYEEQLDLCTHVEFECLPTGGWGYDTLPLFARYLHTLGKTVLNMTGRFHRSWGDFGGIRTEASLEYDLRYGLAHGMRPMVGSHMHPRGDLDGAVFDLTERVYRRLQRLAPWVDGARPLADVGVIIPASGLGYVDLNAWSTNTALLKGAARLLSELKIQFDVLSYHRSWEGYRVLVLPDQVTLDAVAAAKLQAHLERGGAVLSSGWSGLDPARQDFVSPAWGLRYRGPDPHDPAYYSVGSCLAAGIPAMRHNFYCAGAALEALPGTEVLARIVAPYFNRHWDGEHGFLYLPPDRETDQPAVTLRERVAHISHAVFTSYYENAPVPLRTLVGNLLKLLLPTPLVLAPELPSFARVSVTEQPGRRLVHVLAYCPERRGPTMDMIEEPIELRDVKLAVRLDGPAPQRVYLAPDGSDLPCEIRDGYVWTVVPRITGHALVVMEARTM